MSTPGRRDGLLPQYVGPYRLEERLGQGGMGEVYRAWDDRLRRRVAIKHVLAKEAEKANVRQRFRREARTVARLNHGAIVQIYDILETEDDGDWIVMELVEGRTVRELMEAGELDLAAAMRLAREVASGLAAAHDKGVVHRDLKVENVMVTPRGGAKILDFGLAKNVEKRDPSDTTLSGSGVVVGTFRAMAPEQIMEKEIDSRSDLFSFGVLLYEMCTGASPFRAENVVVTMTRVCNHLQPPARTVNPEVSEELSGFIDRLLEKEPEDRPQSAFEVVTFFDDLLGEVSVPPPPSEEAAAAEPAREREPSSAVLAPTEPITTVATAEAVDGGRPAAPGWDAPGAVALRTVLATEVCDLPDLAARLGDEGAAKALAFLAEIRAQLLERYPGQRLFPAIDSLLAFERPSTAIELALAYHRRAASLARELEGPVAVRTGVHLGEVVLPASPPGESTRAPLAAAADTVDFTPRVARAVAALARPGQILFTQSVDELVKRSSIARHFGEEEPVWRNHGLRRLPELDEEVEIFQVGFAGDLALSAPPFSAEIPGSRPAGRPRTGLVAVAGICLVLLAVAGFLALRACSG